MLLILDIGTSSMRAMCMDHQGNVLKSSQRKYELSRTSDGGVRMEMEKLDQALSESLSEIGNYCRENQMNIAGISVTAQRSSVIPMGPEGCALTDAIMWQDKRCAYLLDHLRNKTSRIYEICGMRPSPVFSAPKMQYLKEQTPELYERTEKLIGFQEYVLHYLTGEYVTDRSIASRTCLYDLRKKDWSEELLALFGIDKDKLCDLAEPGSVIGKTTFRINNLLGAEEEIPVVSAGGDQQCAVLGMQDEESPGLICNMGTGAYVTAVTDRLLFDPRMRVNCNVGISDNTWVVEGMVPSAGATLDWLSTVFYSHLDKEEALNTLLMEAQGIPKGAHGLQFLNALAGTGTPEWNPLHKGSFTNILLQHNRGDFVRAALEGLALDVAQCAACVEEVTGERFTSIKVAGGLSRSEFLMGILADTLGRKICPADESEATVRGAFRAGRHALGRENKNEIC